MPSMGIRSLTAGCEPYSVSDGRSSLCKELADADMVFALISGEFTFNYLVGVTCVLLVHR